MKKDNTEVREITEKLEAEIKNVFQSDRYMKYLNVMSKFHDYSSNNCMLILMQRPDATHVAGYKAWQNNFGRQVLRGETGIRILAPSPYKVWQEQDKIDPNTNQPVRDENGNALKEKVSITVQSYRAVSVFDISQTQGKELPRLAQDLTGNVEDYEKIMKALYEISPVPIGFEDIQSKAKGYYNFVENRIAIKEGMSEEQTIKTAIHEIGHALLHNKEALNQLDNEPNRRTKEVQAESIAYTVCKRFGINTSDYSFGYIAGWSSGKETEELRESMDIIRKTASSMITSIEDKFKSMERTMEAPDKELQQSKIDLSFHNERPHPEVEHTR